MATGLNDAQGPSKLKAKKSISGKEECISDFTIETDIGDHAW